MLKPQAIWATVLAVLLPGTLLQADTYIWTGAADNDMTNALNWNPGSAPVKQDEITFDGSGTGYASLNTGGPSAFTTGGSSSLLGLKKVTVTSGQSSDLVLDGGMTMRSFTMEIQAGAGAVTLIGNNDVGQTGHSSGNASFINESSNLATLGGFNRRGNGTGKETNFSGSGDWLVTGDIIGIGEMNKSGSGVLTFSGTAQSDAWYKFTVSEGTFHLTGTLTTRASGPVNIQSGATLSGTGTVGAGRVTNINGTLSPGESPGALTFQDDVVLGADSNLNWQIHDAEGAAGVGTDLSILEGDADLDLSSLTVGNPMNINIWSLSGIEPDANGDAINFDSSQSYEWALFQTDNVIAGFSEDLFSINLSSVNGTGGFSNDLDGGIFSVALSDDETDLLLEFTAVIPEPSSLVLLCVAFSGLLVFTRPKR